MSAYTREFTIGRSGSTYERGLSDRCPGGKSRGIDLGLIIHSSQHKSPSFNLKLPSSRREFSLLEGKNNCSATLKEVQQVRSHQRKTTDGTPKNQRCYITETANVLQG